MNMKRITFFFILACLSVFKATAYEWTDESGVKWFFEQESYRINQIFRIYNFLGYWHMMDSKHYHQ